MKNLKLIKLKKFEPSLCKRSRRNIMELLKDLRKMGLNQAFVNEVAETYDFYFYFSFYSLNQAFVNEVAETATKESQKQKQGLNQAFVNEVAETR